MNNYIVRSYRFVIVVTRSVTRRTIKDYSHVLKTHKKHEKYKNKFNSLTMDQLVKVTLAIDNDCNGQVVPHYYIYQIISVVSQVLD